MDNQPWYLLLLFIFSSIDGGECTMLSEYWEKDSTHLWYTTTDDVIYTTTDSRASAVFCALICLDNPECLMYGYSSIMATCRGFRSLHYSPVAIIEGSEVIFKHRQRCRRAGYDLLEDGPLCVKKYLDSLAWDDAQAQCKNDHGRLAVIDNKKKLDTFVIYSENIAFIKVWVGITDKAKEGAWVWVNGARLDTNYWKLCQLNDISRDYKPNQRSADCGCIDGRNLRDDHCLLPRSYVCERADLI
ncbi:type-2 ice-structuring protein-like [Pecten maximus]|uniref:type-2 ice-structuring protein-like n=1 Tax=Pecten maximus TaxID=6579 RepID=UPI0014582838|nr:type-2 ice-structuring protein-like [Pecten maximus]